VGERSRWAVGLFLPIFAVVFVAVRTAWLAHVHSLSESELHLQVFEHSTAVVATLWSVIVGLAAVSAWWAAGRVVARRSGRPR
jgi:hypothetical protein